MARRTFVVVDVTEILIHWHAGRSVNQVAESLGLDRKTVRKYVAPAIEAGLAPGGPTMTQAEWARLVMAWFPHLVDTRLRRTTWPQIAEHHEYIKAHLKSGVTQATIWQRLRDEHGLQASYASLKRYVADHMPEETRRDRVVVLRDEVEPGSEAQIDYGLLGSWVEPGSGRRRKVWAFVMVLACSRHMFVRPVLTMDQQSWTAAHVAAFEFFGGVAKRLVPDNLRTGVARTDLYDPKINRSYAELAEHYGVLVDPAPAASHATRAGWSGPCRISATASGEDVNSFRCSRCKPPRSIGACRWPGGARAVRCRAPRRCRCSTRSKRQRWYRFPPGSSCWPSGVPPRSDRISTSRSARPCTRCLGSTWASGSTPG
jgi:transposase